MISCQLSTAFVLVPFGLLSFCLFLQVNVTMAEVTEVAEPESEELEDQVMSVFPAPPLAFFAKHFNDDLLLSLQYPADDLMQVDEESFKSAERPKRYPSPPPVPVDGIVDVFGARLTPTEHQVRDLEEQGLNRLGDDTKDRRKLLKKLMWSTISKCLEILDCLIKNPRSERRSVLLEELQTIFINLHHVINEFRLPQATDSVVELLKFQTLRNINQSETLLQSMTSALDVVRSCTDGSKALDDSAIVVNGILADGSLTEFDNELQRLGIVVKSLRQSLTAPVASAEHV